jgi:hypothetical protein
VSYDDGQQREEIVRMESFLLRNREIKGVLRKRIIWETNIRNRF